MLPVALTLRSRARTGTGNATCTGADSNPPGLGLLVPKHIEEALGCTALAIVQGIRAEPPPVIVHAVQEDCITGELARLADGDDSL
mmetsp:Transcript_34882/g.93116  ORF Transcript_34882/g.93116 Transcript_34882/m.93116 type:complete len:86 (-) Transcript_34882:1929-2186(-)